MEKYLINEYKTKMKDIIKMSFGNGIKEEAIDKYLNTICAKAEQKNIKANIRNVYKYIYHDQIDVNQIIDDVKTDNLNILSNGLYTENWKPISYTLIDKWKKDRKVYKKKMLEAKEKGNDPEYNYCNKMQNKIKADTNSIYGASTMAGGFISNIDMAGSITAQARNFISEMVWDIERFLGSNYTFENVNEIYCWFDCLFKLKDSLDWSDLKDYITYIPTADECMEKFAYTTRDVKNIRKNMLPLLKTSFIMFDSMSVDRRIFYYYSYDPIKLISKNPKILELVNKLAFSKYEYINPYIFDGIKPDTTKEELLKIFTEKFDEETGKNITEFYLDLLLFRKIMKTFCFATVSIANRVEKYQIRRRKVCVIGDTDSTMPSYRTITRETLKALGKEELIKTDSVVSTRLIMVWITVTSDLMEEACMRFVVDCNQYDPNDAFFMRMKNEFFFPMVLLYGVKKHYVGLQTIQEGKMVPKDKQLAITGRALGSSSLNEFVTEHFLNIIENDILRSDVFDPLIVFERVMDVKKHIQEQLLAGNKTFGIYAAFNGAHNVKNPETTSNVRAALIWNDLYPDDYISPGDKIYVFNTSLKTIEDIENIDEKYHDIKERIKQTVFKPKDGMDFSRFGLKTFVMPAYGDTVSIPEWIIPYILINDMAEKHLQPMTALFPSLLLSSCSYVNEGSDTKKLGISSLIKF